jgi:hypothetical protein
LATVHVTLGRVSARADTGSTLPVLSSVPRAAETLVSTPASAAAQMVGQVGEVWSITVTGGDVFVAFGAEPVAASGAGRLLLAGQSREFAVTAVGEKLAVISA